MRGLIQRVSEFAYHSDRGGREESRDLGKITGALLPWGVVSATGADLEIFLDRRDLDRAVAAIGVEIGRLVRNGVLATQFVFNRGEGMSDVLHLVWKESSAAGRRGQVLENLVAAENHAAVVGRYGI